MEPIFEKRMIMRQRMEAIAHVKTNPTKSINSIGRPSVSGVTSRAQSLKPSGSKTGSKRMLIDTSSPMSEKTQQSPAGFSSSRSNRARTLQAINSTAKKKKTTFVSQGDGLSVGTLDSGDSLTISPDQSVNSLLTIEDKSSLGVAQSSPHHIPQPPGHSKSSLQAASPRRHQSLMPTRLGMRAHYTVRPHVVFNIYTYSSSVDDPSPHLSSNKTEASSPQQPVPTSGKVRISQLLCVSKVQEFYLFSLCKQPTLVFTDKMTLPSYIAKFDDEDTNGL
jgi:hypothetical protein